jgi:hypothetical protein
MVLLSASTLDCGHPERWERENLASSPHFLRKFHAAWLSLYVISLDSPSGASSHSCRRSPPNNVYLFAFKAPRPSADSLHCYGTRNDIECSGAGIKGEYFCRSALEQVLTETYNIPNPSDGNPAECGDTAACGGDLGWRIRTGHSLRDPHSRVCAPRCAKHDIATLPNIANLYNSNINSSYIGYSV